MLADLPDDFQQDKGGGSSFLASCMTKDGDHWGEHPNMEVLMCLGLAAGLASYCMPRELWKILPGGMPYFVVNG